MNARNTEMSRSDHPDWTQADWDHYADINNPNNENFQEGWSQEDFDMWANINNPNNEAYRG